MKELEELAEADTEFRIKCRELGVVPWTVNPISKVPYQTGVSTSWPNKSGDDLRSEVYALRDAAHQIASKYKVSVSYEGLHPAAGGSLVMYFGFKN